MRIDWRHWDWNVHVEGAGDSHWSFSSGCWADGCTYPHNYTAQRRIRRDKNWIFVKTCMNRYLWTHTFLLPRCPLKQKLQALLGTQTTSTPTSFHMSRCRSCLFQSERSASSLSQSEGIQSTSGAEYQAGCCRVSSCSTDTVDSSALFMGTAGAYEMASRWGLDFYSPQLYCGWRDAWHLQQLLIVSKNDNRRNAKGQGTWKAGLPEDCLSGGKLNICRFSIQEFDIIVQKALLERSFRWLEKKENTCSRTKIAPIWKIKYIFWLWCRLLSVIKSINTDHKVNMKTSFY